MKSKLQSHELDLVDERGSCYKDMARRITQKRGELAVKDFSVF